MQAVARVSQKGQVVIPAEIRRRLHVSKLVVITEEDGSIIMRPATSLEDAFGIDGKKMLEVAREIVNERRREAEAERS